MDTLQDFDQIEHYVNIVNAVRSYAILISKYYGKESYNQQHWAVTLFQNYVKKNYNTDVTITKLARLYNLNEKYIGRLFKTQTNMSFNQYLNNVRVIEAKVLLRETEANIINISLEVGFNNVTYFNRVFKEIVGKTPLEYRESKRLL